MSSKTFEYRLRPTARQEAALWAVLIGSRRMYNDALEELVSHYKETGQYLHLYEQDKRHGKDRHPDLPAVVVDTTLKRLHRSFSNFFRGRREGRQVGFPRFKGATRWNSFAFRDAANCLDGGYFKAGKVCGGRLRTVVHRPLEGTFNFARIVRRPSGWYLQCICEVSPRALPPKGGAIGLDMGITALVADSDGQRFPNPKPLRRSSERLAKAQRHLSRRKRGSQRRRKARHRVARLHERIANQRKDTLHKLSRRYVDTYQVIVVEDLQVANLARNHHLARSIHDSSWGLFRWMLSYKAAWAGRELVAVPPQYTSQQCSSCGAYVEKTLSVRTHVCPWCGYVDDRDVNAARNILHAGVVARTEPSPIGAEGRSDGPQVTHRDDGRSRGA
jgi:putative transposase